MTPIEFEEILKRGAYAWPGGYPTYFVMRDYEVISFEAAMKEKELILAALKEPGTDKQWEIVSQQINWENDALYCAHTDKRIESAYGE